jgi:hypothetical protein
VRQGACPADCVDALRARAPDPVATIMEFLDSAYEAAATLGRWDIDALAV